MPDSSRREFLYLGTALSGLYFLLLCVFVAAVPIGSNSEAREAHVVQGMLSSGEWLLPSRNGIVASKPPLFHWTAAALADLAGVSPMVAARLVSALAAALMLFFTVQFTLKLFPRSGGRLAFLAYIALATNYEFLRLSLDCRVDMTFALLVFMAIRAAIENMVDEASVPGDVSKRPGQAVPVFFLAAGLAVLAKGPLGVVLPCLIVVPVLGMFTGCAGVLQFIVRGSFWWLVFLVLASSWYAFGAFQGAEALLDRQLVFENISRFFGGEHVNSRSAWYYLLSGLRASFPWFEVFLISLPFGFKALYAAVFETGVHGEKRNQAMLLAVVVLGLVFFSSASGKRYSYLAPLFPFLSIYVAAVLLEFWDRIGEDFRARLCSDSRLIFVCVAQLALFTLLVFAFVTLPWSYPHAVVSSAHVWMQRHMLPGLLVLAVFLLLLHVIVRLGLFQGAGIRRVLLFGTFQSALFCAVFYGYGVRNDLPRNENAAAQINAIVSEKAFLGVVKERLDEYFDIVLYYIRRPVTIVDPKSNSLACEGFYLAKQEWYGPFRKRIEDSAVVVEEKARFRQVPDEWAGGTERDMVLFACGKAAKDAGGEG